MGIPEPPDRKVAIRNRLGARSYLCKRQTVHSLKFAVMADSKKLSLTIEAPESAGDVLDALFNPFLTGSQSSVEVCLFRQSGNDGATTSKRANEVGFRYTDKRLDNHNHGGGQSEPEQCWNDCAVEQGLLSGRCRRRRRCGQESRSVHHAHLRSLPLP